MVQLAREHVTIQFKLYCDRQWYGWDTVLQYKKLYYDRRLGEDCVTIHLVYCDKSGSWLGRSCHDIKFVS